MPGMRVAALTVAMAGFSTYGYRLLRAATLDANLYEEVEHDRTAVAQAMATVPAFEPGGGHRRRRRARQQRHGVRGVQRHGARRLDAVGGADRPRRRPADARSADAHLTGRAPAHERVAAAPGLLQVFAAFQGTTLLVFALTTLWMLAAMVVAVRQALDYRTTRHAIAACAVAWAIAVLLPLAVAVLFSRPAS